LELEIKVSTIYGSKLGNLPIVVQAQTEILGMVLGHLFVKVTYIDQHTVNDIFNLRVTCHLLLPV